MRIEYVIVSMVLMIVVLAAVVMMLSGVMPNFNTIFSRVG
jgi:hypothetical protein